MRLLKGDSEGRGMESVWRLGEDIDLSSLLRGTGTLNRDGMQVYQIVERECRTRERECRGHRRKT